MFELIVNHFLGHIPTWVFPFAAGAGFGLFIIAGIAQHIQPVRIYALVLRPIAFIVFVLGVFFYGGAGVVAIQQEAMKEAQHRIDLAEQASKDSNDKLVAALAANAHLIKGREYGVKTQIIHDRVLIDKDCAKINETAVDDYNRAIRNSATFTPAETVKK
jgi:uncharacterized membrane protein (Fun14 family)